MTRKRWTAMAAFVVVISARPAQPAAPQSGPVLRCGVDGERQPRVSGRNVDPQWPSAALGQAGIDAIARIEVGAQAPPRVQLFLVPTLGEGEGVSQSLQRRRLATPVGTDEDRQRTERQFHLAEHTIVADADPGEHRRWLRSRRDGSHRTRSRRSAHPQGTA